MTSPQRLVWGGSELTTQKKQMKRSSERGKEMTVIKSELFYTGGNIWCTDGELDDGTVFSSSDNMGFIIYDRKIYDRLEEFKKEHGDQDMALCDICGWNEVEDLVIRYTDDDAQETFELWKQIYDQNEDDCVDIDYLREELYDIFNKEKPIAMELKLTKDQLRLLADILSRELMEYEQMVHKNEKQGISDEVAENDTENLRIIFDQIDDAYCTNC